MAVIKEKKMKPLKISYNKSSQSCQTNVDNMHHKLEQAGWSLFGELEDHFPWKIIFIYFSLDQ